MRPRVLVLALVCALPASLQAQAEDDTLHVPAGVLEVLQVPAGASRPFAMLRAIRVLYSAPRRDPIPRAIADFERLMEALERVDRDVKRAGARGVSLSMAARQADQVTFRDLLAALGLRVREQRRTASVEKQDGNAAVALRALLLRTGLDADGIQQRLNAGETVQIPITTIGLPLPLPFERWAADVFSSRVTPDVLFNAIIRNRDASLLYYGVQSMTPETRDYVAKTPELVQVLHGRAPLVAAFGAAFRVGADGRVEVPGSVGAEELWEALVDEKVTQPARFARGLFGRDAGRLAYFAETLWALDDAHARFALGLWIDDRRVRNERFRALYDVFAQMDPSWSPADVPFTRPSYDAGLLLSNLQLDEAGMMVLAHRRLWERAVTGIDIPAPDDRQMRDPGADGFADAAFLAGLLAGKFPRERRVILERVAFGQRNFGGRGDPDMQDVLVALRAYGRFPAAMLALERIGIRQPAQFAQAARRALALERLDTTSVVPLLAQFQGSLALLERIARTGAAAPALLERLVTSLTAVDFNDGRYRGGIAEWLRSQLMAALPAKPSQTAEERLLDALVDRMGPGFGPFSWEGQEYVADTERPRRELRVLRERQKGNTLDSLLALYEHTAVLSDPALTLEAVKSRTAAVKAGASTLSAARPWPDAADKVPAIDRVVERAVKDLDGIRRDSDLRKAPRIAAALVDSLDYLLGETLVALAYAASLGDTGRGFAAAVDISHRHTFGTAISSEDYRLIAWRRPVRGSTNTPGDAVTGSLLGLDLALSRTRLRRLAADGRPDTPKLNGNDRASMTDTVALLNPRLLDDGGSTQIADAVRLGRNRVEQAVGDSAALDALAVEARIAPSRRGLLAWTARNTSRDIVGLFSLAELFRLGGGRRTAIDGWGTSHEALTGCFCLRFPDDTGWELSVGRADTGQTGARVAELNLRVAVLLADLRVPAVLFPGVMALATQDYIDGAPLVHADDWVAIAGWAAAIDRERMEDYVAAVVASGPMKAVEAAGAR